MALAIMSVTVQKWPFLRALFQMLKPELFAHGELETFLNSQLKEGLIPWISAAF